MKSVGSQSIVHTHLKEHEHISHFSIEMSTKAEYKTRESINSLFVNRTVKNHITVCVRYYFLLTSVADLNILMWIYSHMKTDPTEQITNLHVYWENFTFKRNKQNKEKKNKKKSCFALLNFCKLFSLHPNLVAVTFISLFLWTKKAQLVTQLNFDNFCVD